MKQFLTMQKATAFLFWSLFGSFLAVAAGHIGLPLDPLITGTATGTILTTIFSLSGGFSGALTSGIDASELVDEYGLFYKNDGKAADRRKRLKQMLYNTESNFDKYFKKVETENTREEWAYSDHTEVLQPYQHTFTEKGELSLYPNPAVLFWAKVDLGYIPNHLVNTWAGFLTDNNLDVAQYPFVQYVLEHHVIPRMQEDWKVEVSYKGVFVAPTNGTPGPAHTTADGVHKKLKNIAGAGLYSPFDEGVVPTDPVACVEYMEALTARLPERYRDRPMTWRVGEHIRDRFIEGTIAKYNMFFNRTGSNEVTDPFIYKKKNIKIEGFSEMGDSDLIWITGNDNGLLLQKGSAKQSMVKVETAKRQLFMFTDFHRGYHFEIPTEIWSNDQDLD